MADQKQQVIKCDCGTELVVRCNGENIAELHCKCGNDYKVTIDSVKPTEEGGV